MKFTCATKDLANAVSAATRIVNTHSTVPILSNVLLEATADAICIRATDLRITLEKSFPTSVEEPGATTVDAKLFSSYLNNLAPDSMITLALDGAKLTIKSGKSKYQFHTISATEWPATPAEVPSPPIVIKGADLRAAVASVSFASSNEEARGATLMGTLLQIDEHAVSFVATDGYRLAVHRSDMDSAYTGKYVVPTKALVETTRNVAGDEDVELRFLGQHQNHLQIHSGDTTIAVRLVDGAYPNYEQIVPKDEGATITANTADILAALRRAELLSNERTSRVNLALSENLVVITAQGDSTGSAYEEIEVKYDGKPYEILFNARYLNEILTHIDTDEVTIKIVGALSPAIIKSSLYHEGTDGYYVLMPLRP